MDHLIPFSSSSEKAIQGTKDVDRVLATGNFKIRERMSSSEVVGNKLTQHAMTNSAPKMKPTEQMLSIWMVRKEPSPQFCGEGSKDVKGHCHTILPSL